MVQMLWPYETYKHNTTHSQLNCSVAVYPEMMADWPYYALFFVNLHGLTATYHFLLDTFIRYDIVALCLTVNHIN